VSRLKAKNPDLVIKYGMDRKQNLASGGGGFGPVRIKINVFVVNISSMSNPVFGCMHVFTLFLLLTSISFLHLLLIDSSFI
jgi:hypothetical protein